MKKLFFITIAIFITGARTHAQELGIYETENRYPVSYYPTTGWGANGFRTVEEQNSSMYEAIAAMQRERARENSINSQAFIDNKKQDNKIIANKRSNSIGRKQKNRTL